MIGDISCKVLNLEKTKALNMGLITKKFVKTS